jgi:hypothetical protein
MAVRAPTFQGMAKKRKAPIFKRTDAERRVRQGERLSRLLRTLRCIMGPGRWDADSLARELEVSPRTIHRIMQTLSMANVPWYFCKEDGCYRVRSGYRFPGVEENDRSSTVTDPAAIKRAVDSLIRELARATETLKRVSEELAGGMERS